MGIVSKINDAMGRVFGSTVSLPREAVGFFVLPSGEVEVYLPKGGVTEEAAALVEAVLTALDTEETDGEG